jgi:hypothetical protein
MNQKEFRDWYKQHRSCFPGIDRWFADMLDSQRSISDADRAKLTQADVLLAWKGCLEDVDLIDACRATRILHRGEAKELPRSFDDHPRVIRDIARQMRRSGHSTEPFGPKLKQIADGQYEDTFKCPTCRDWGLVEVWHPKAMDAMREGRYGEAFTRYTWTTRCNCEAGDRRPECIDLRYNERTMLKIEHGGMQADVDRLREFIKIENREPAFDDWNNR